MQVFLHAHAVTTDRSNRGTRREASEQRQAALGGGQQGGMPRKKRRTRGRCRADPPEEEANLRRFQAGGKLWVRARRDQARAAIGSAKLERGSLSSSLSMAQGSVRKRLLTTGSLDSSWDDAGPPASHARDTPTTEQLQRKDVLCTYATTH